MSEYVLVLSYQKFVEIRIGTYNCDIKNRTRKRHLVDVGTKFDIAAEKTTHLGGQATSAVKRRLVISRHARINVTNENSIWCRFKRRGTPTDSKTTSISFPSRTVTLKPSLTIELYLAARPSASPSVSEEAST